MKSVLSSMLFSSLLAAGGGAAAGPVFEYGKTVDHVDFSVTFSAIHSFSDLAAYRENGVLVSTYTESNVGAKLPLDYPTVGHHYTSVRKFGWTTIRGGNDEVFSGIDFRLGVEGVQRPASMLFIAYLDGVTTEFGAAELDRGVMRLANLGAFDELWLNARGYQPPTFGAFDPVELDDIHLQLWSSGALQALTHDVAEPGQLALFGAALAALGRTRRRRR